MCSWIKCGDAHRHGTAFESTCNTFPKSSGPKHLLQLVGRRDFELIVAAIAGLFVGPPSLEYRRMPEPIALDMVVLHLRDPVDAQWLPRHILACAPAALRARHAAGLRLSTRPFPPGVVLQGVLPQRCQFLHELLAHCHRE